MSGFSSTVTWAGAALGAGLYQSRERGRGQAISPWSAEEWVRWLASSALLPAGRFAHRCGLFICGFDVFVFFFPRTGWGEEQKIENWLVRQESQQGKN